MDIQLTLLNHQLHLLAAPRPQLDRLVQASLARLALSGHVQVIDGGNHFDPYAIARLVRRQTGDLDAALGRIAVARAFTSYQVLAVLETRAASLDSASLEGHYHPLIVLDLLATFADENVRCTERSRLLDGCISQLQRLSVYAPVLVTLPAYRSAALPADFPARLASAAHKVWRFEPAAPASTQPSQQPSLF
jgi:hypothetical protein